MHYRETQEIDLKIIAYGKSYTAVEISRMSHEIFYNLNELQEDDYISLSNLSPILKLLNNFFRLSFGKEETLKIYEEIEDYPLTKKNFKKKINKITESFLKYGKNIYPW